jgi:TRAP-type C4-dicarboxylate transport system substrate-binding protein
MRKPSAGHIAKFVIFLGCLAASLGPGAGAQTILHVASAYPEDNFQTRNLQQFAAEVNAAIGKDLQLVVHPNGTLAKPADIYPQAAAGKIGGGEVLMSSLENVSPLYGVDSIPFLVSGYDDAQRLWRTSRPGIEKRFRQDGLQLLFAAPWPPQNLYATRSLERISDARGLRMRTYNQATDKIAGFIGATPVLFQVIELEKAIADNKLDLMLTSSWTGVQTKAWSRMKYYYVVNTWIPKNAIFISKSVFDHLPPESAARLIDLAARAEQRAWELCKQKDHEFEAMLKDNKVAISADVPFLLDDFRRLGEKLARDWLKKAGIEGSQLLLSYEMEKIHISGK